MRRVKVLVVDDEPLVMMGTVAVVVDAGFEALTAANADEAIAILESVEGIRIVLTDIDMPGSMDGLKLAAAVRDRWPPIKIIVVSGKQQPAAHLLPEGGVFFPKPFDIASMTATLTSMAT